MLWRVGEEDPQDESGGEDGGEPGRMGEVGTMFGRHLGMIDEFRGVVFVTWLMAVGDGVVGDGHLSWSSQELDEVSFASWEAVVRVLARSDLERDGT